MGILIRPISIALILSKAHANRIKIVISEFVSHEQFAFLKGRSIQDNILIAQEVAHSIHDAKGKTPYILVKINLEKAYAKLSWDDWSDDIWLGTPIRDQNSQQHYKALIATSCWFT
ncbi:hypothetical protein Cni_G07306 [Canna indica]|uniref:Reverse transcriptase domain-containing protein n=1 Tax=Canna indica TaxID=4628 RepID=A0AAQ3K051_9LILI|nr:hypothetical protein Cni_G07306 [Canna indica]